MCIYYNVDRLDCIVFALNIILHCTFLLSMCLEVHVQYVHVHCLVCYCTCIWIGVNHYTSTFNNPSSTVQYMYIVHVHVLYSWKYWRGFNFGELVIFK